MTSPPSKTSADLAEDLRMLDGMVARARGEIANGGVIDLEPLAIKVTALCAEIDRLPGDEAMRFKPTLIALISELNAFGQQIEAGLEALARELGEHGRRRDAAAAYGKGDGA